jgi:hypothetical protein
MPFRREEVEAFCRLTEDHLNASPVTAEQKQAISDHVDSIVRAHETLKDSGVEVLSDTTEIALVILLM